jgi:hypothetical protein
MLLFTVKFKALHKLTLAMLVAGLCKMDLDRDILNIENDSLEYHIRHLVAAIVTQIFLYMVNIGVQKGLFCTGEALPLSYRGPINCEILSMCSEQRCGWF